MNGREMVVSALQSSSCQTWTEIYRVRGRPNQVAQPQRHYPASFHVQNGKMDRPMELRSGKGNDTYTE